MIIFDFEIDEDELREDLESDIPTTDLDLFVLTFFLMPVRLNINGVEFFQFDNPKPWDCRIGTPILNIASNGLIAVKSLPSVRKVEYVFLEVGSILEMTMLPENNVSIDFNKKIHVVISYDELLTAFDRFAASVRKFLNERVPQMNQHPYWGSWLRGEHD